MVTDLAVWFGEATGGRKRWTSQAAVATASGLAQRGPRPHDTVFARVTARRIAAASPADRKALEAALAAVGEHSAVIERAAASGAPVAAVAGLAAQWDGLPEQARAWLAAPLGRSGKGPVRWGPVVGTQVDQTTCGAASLSLMAMMTDPFVALWVATGQSLGSYQPPEVLRAVVEGLPSHTVAERWHALQRATHRASTRWAVGPLPWPRSLGTPPWKADNVARCAGVRLRGLVIDDAKPTDLAAAIAHVRAALRDGIPVPVYVGGDSTVGLDSVVPRHVVLITGYEGDVLHIYEPGSGAVHEVHSADLSQPHGRLKALGNWSRIVWLVLPTPRG
jgi:hypothetical protein